MIKQSYFEGINISEYLPELKDRVYINTGHEASVFIITPRMYQHFKDQMFERYVVHSSETLETVLGLPVAIIQMKYPADDFGDMSREFIAFI